MVIILLLNLSSNLWYFLVFSFSEKDVYVGYLPLAHVLELVAGKVECLHKCVILQTENLLCGRINEKVTESLLSGFIKILNR